jgi:hypothetical protein
MPTFVKTKSGDNYRIKGEKVRLAWRLACFFGLLIHFEEDPSGNTLYIAGRWIAHFAVLSQEAIAAAERLMAEQRTQVPAQGKHIIEPTAMIPRRRPN